MQTEIVVVVSGVILMFVVFGLALAWADRQTRHTSDHFQQPAE